MEYRHLHAWCKMLDDKTYLQQQEVAIKEQAPIDSIYYKDGRWHRFSEITNRGIISHIYRVLTGVVKHYFDIGLVVDNKKFYDNIGKVYSHNTIPFGPLVYGLIYGVNPNLVIETGTNNGYITAWVAKVCLELDIEFYSIDLYSGDDTQYYESMNRGLYEKAKSNLSICGVLNGVTKFINTDVIEFLLNPKYHMLLRNLGFAVVDDCHEEEHVYTELKILWEYLIPGGMIAIHDIVDAIGVQNAVSRFLSESTNANNRLWFFISSGYAVIQKNK